MIAIEASLQGGIVVLLALAVILFLKAQPSRSGRYGIALTLCVLASQLDELALPASAMWFNDLVKTIGCANIPLFWLFARSWFDDDFNPGTTDLLLAIGFVALSSASIWAGSAAASPIGPVDAIIYAASIAFAFDALRCAWRDRAADLVESRRRARVAFVMIVTLVVLWTIGAEITGRLMGATALAAVAGNIGMLTGVFGLALVLLGLRHDDMFAPIARPGEPANQIETPVFAPDESDTPLAAALAHAMAQDRLYRAPELTIGAIAARLGVPEYRVRRLVNGRFGHRNINDYLNGLRVAEVRAALADPSQAEVPILTIAMDAGFGSVAVFNRAFKARQGETPSAYRRRHLEPPPID